MLNKGELTKGMPLQALLRDGEPMGKTPLQLELEPGIYELTLKKDGYHDFVIEVEVEAEAGALPFDVKLVRSD